MQAPLVMLLALVATSTAFSTGTPHNRVSRSSYYYEIPIADEPTSKEKNTILIRPDQENEPTYEDIFCNGRDCEHQRAYVKVIDFKPRPQRDGRSRKGPNEACSLHRECVRGSRCSEGRCSGPYDKLDFWRRSPGTNSIDVGQWGLSR